MHKTCVNALLASVLLTAGAAHAVNKCTDAKTGHVSYSDAPCPGTGEVVREAMKRQAAERRAEEPSVAGPSAAELAEQQRKQDKAAAAERVRFCGRDDLAMRVQPGISEDEFLRCTWPGSKAKHRINETRMLGGGTLRQYVFEPGSGTRYVHVRNGVVTSVSD